MIKNVVLLPLALLAVGCASSSLIRQSEDYTAVGNHHQAYHVLLAERTRLQAEGETPSEAFEAAYRKAEIAYVIDRALRQIFQDREEEGLATLAEAEQLGADPAIVAGWRGRATYKLAKRATEAGNEHLAKGELQPAMEMYLKALDRRPGMVEALEGTEKVREAMSRLTERAQQQFLEAVRKLPEFRYVEVQWHATNATENDPQREDAKAILVQARSEILDAMFARGKELQNVDQFGAALIEYKGVQRVDPGYPGVVAAITAMEKEVDATRLVEKAKVEMRMERFVQARQSLDDALKLSEFSRAGIGELVMQCEKMRGESAYRAARDLEILGKKQDALAAFRAIVAEWPNGISDEVARAEALQVDVDGAKTEWAAAEAAEAAGKDAEALEHYRNAERYCPEYLDVKARIERLRAKTSGG